MQKQYNIQWRDNFQEIEKHAQSLHNETKKLAKDMGLLSKEDYAKGLAKNYAESAKQLQKCNTLISNLKGSMEGLSKNSKTRLAIEKELNQALYQRQKIQKDMKTITDAVNKSQNNQLKSEIAITNQVVATYKEQKKIQNAQEMSVKTAQRHVEATKANNAALKESQAEARKIQQEMDRLHKKAQDVGSMTKSILQDKNLNTKGAKDTAAQWEYQAEAIKRTALEIKNAENSGEAYKHMLESMVYEVKHTTGKSLFQDSIDGTKKLINLENKRYEAQKAGKQIMEDFYNSEIRKQKELLEQINSVANNPQKLQQALQENASYIKNLLPQDMQADFQAQFEKTGQIDAAWAQGMRQYVIELQNAYNKQVQLNEAKARQNTQDGQYKLLKADLQEIWEIENNIAKLSKDPNRHQAEIDYYNQLLTKKKQELGFDERIKGLTDQQKKDIEKLTQEQKEYNEAIKAQADDWRNNQKKVSALGDTIRKVFNYVLVYKGFIFLTQGIKQAVETMKDLDKAFTDIQMVTGETDKATTELAYEYNQLAKSLGATTQEVAEGAAEWLRQGKTAEETTQLLTASMVLSKVGAIESAEATELLTSSLNGYKFSAEEAISVVDKISSIDLAAATSSYELATALARTANSADDAGVSFDKLLAMIGTVSSVTRKSASTIRRII